LRLARPADKRVGVRLVLTPHPVTPGRFVDRLEVELSRSGATLSLHFQVRGRISTLRFPARAAPERTDGLWRWSCFEAFIKRGTGPGYFEFNLSPSTEWAAYAFDRYREGMKPVWQVPHPEIDVLRGEDLHALRAIIDLKGLEGLDPNATWRIGLSAVIEDAQRAKSYWALAHPPGPPDFHHEDCFALELPPAE
jgi:hypothetical protein